MIVGNVEDYIERCLESFLPIADEVCIVRAIGSQKPDQTLQRVADACLKYSEKTGRQFVVRTDEYRNKPDHSDWPHVDDFAAARQASFDLATGEYCFWCDSDDILESGADIVRQLAERAEYPAYVFPYNIFGRGISVPRERMMTKESGRWRYPVHECFDFHIQPIRAIEDRRVVVTHMPGMKKTGSPDRNLRILESIPREQMNAGLLYHLHGELAGTGRKVEAIEAAKAALRHPDLGQAERYELFLNLSRMCEDNLKLREAYLTQAWAADPTRREALGLLACNALDLGDNENGLAYARQMMALPEPLYEAWNSRAAAYGWVGYEIFSQALRANGKLDEAEGLRRVTLAKAGGARITLIHATRGRPQKASMARKIWHDLAERPDRIEHIFVIDEDDEASQVLRRMHHAVAPKGGGCVAAWNIGAETATSEVMIQMSDDWTPPPLWDKIILERLGDLSQPKVLAISDGTRTDDLLCMVICTKAYWAQDFYMFHPWFTGVYSDNEATERAYRRGQVIQARDVVFNHEHPIWDKAKWDRTYAEQNAPERYQQGLQVYNELKQGNDFSTVPGWFNYIPFYSFIADRLKDGDSVAEIGVWMGRSIIFMAQALKRRGKKVKLYAVDTFKGEANQPAHYAAVQEAGGSIRAVFEANIQRCGVADMITILEGDSAEMAAHVADGELAFAFIDAAHEYEPVRRDLAAWRNKVKAGGILAGHDAAHEPVIKAVNEAFPGVATAGPVWLTQI